MSRFDISNWGAEQRLVKVASFDPAYSEPYFIGMITSMSVGADGIVEVLVLSAGQWATGVFPMPLRFNFYGKAKYRRGEDEIGEFTYMGELPPLGWQALLDWVKKENKPKPKEEAEEAPKAEESPYEAPAAEKEVGWMDALENAADAAGVRKTAVANPELRAKPNRTR